MMACSINENVYDAKVKPGTAFTPTTRCARLDPFILELVIDECCRDVFNVKEDLN